MEMLGVGIGEEPLHDNYRWESNIVHKKKINTIFLSYYELEKYGRCCVLTLINEGQ